jgi:hypothetical protein
LAPQTIKSELSATFAQVPQNPKTPFVCLLNNLNNIKMKFGELIEQAVVCIKSFNPVYKTIDSHADEFLANVS